MARGLAPLRSPGPALNTVVTRGAIFLAQNAQVTIMAAGLFTDPPGSLQRSPNALDGFKGGRGPQERGRRERNGWKGI